MPLSRKIVFLIALFSSIGLSSCVELLNEVTINKDKSGTAFIGIRVNALGGLIDMSSDYIDDEIRNSIIHFPSDAQSKLKDIKGIHSIETFTRIGQGRIGIEFQFDNPKALNKAYYKLLGENKKWYYPKLLRIRNHSVKAKNISPYIKRYFQHNESFITKSNLLKYLKYTTVIHTPKKIMETAKGNVAADGKTLLFSVPMKKILNESASCGNYFKY